jgi:hypothetical protein
MNFTPLADQPYLLKATASVPWLPGGLLTLFIEDEAGEGPSAAQLTLAHKLVENALFDYFRWIQMKTCPPQPAGVWALLEQPEALFDWRCDEAPPTFRLSWSVRPMDGDLVAVEVTPWEVVGVGEYGASELEKLSFIRAQLEPSE